MSLFTISRPIPLDPPVTIATLGLPESASCTRPSDEADPDVMIVFSLVFRRLALNCRPSAGRVAVWLRRKHLPDRTVSLPPLRSCLALQSACLLLPWSLIYLLCPL